MRRANLTIGHTVRRGSMGQHLQLRHAWNATHAERSTVVDRLAVRLALHLRHVHRLAQLEWRGHWNTRVTVSSGSPTLTALFGRIVNTTNLSSWYGRRLLDTVTMRVVLRDRRSHRHGQVGRRLDRRQVAHGDGHRTRRRVDRRIRIVLAVAHRLPLLGKLAHVLAHATHRCRRRTVDRRNRLGTVGLRYRVRYRLTRVARGASG